MTGQEFAAKALYVYQNNWGYIFGTAGEMWTQAKQDALASKAGNDNYTLSIQYGSKWIGHNVADCSGLVCWIAKQLGMSLPHGSNSQMRKCCATVDLANVPIGALVFKLRNGTDYYHVGIYIGNNAVVEAQGTKTGVVTSRLSSWHVAGLLPDVDYSGSTPAPDPDSQPIAGNTAIVDVPNDGSLNVRDQPSTSGKKQDVIREGDQVEILAAVGGWAKIRYEKTGYVMSKYLKEAE